MAHTDKTDPFWVRLGTGYYASDEYHDHTHGPCDLAPTRWEQFIESHDSWGRGRCTYIFVYTGRNVCACDMCHGSWYEWDKKWMVNRKKPKNDLNRWRDEFNASGDITDWWA